MYKDNLTKAKLFVKKLQLNVSRFFLLYAEYNDLLNECVIDVLYF